MSIQAWHVVVLLIVLMLIAAAGFGLYWVVRRGVRAGVRDADDRRQDPPAP